MANIEDRVVSMSWESAKFQQGISHTITAVGKLNTSLRELGTKSGLDDVEKRSGKINFQGLTTAIDKLKSKLSFSRESASFGDIDKAAEKVTLSGPNRALDLLKGKISRVGSESSESFGQIERASGKVSLSGLGGALSGLSQKFGALEVAAGVAFAGIITKAGQAGAQITKDLTIAPVSTGLKEYEIRLNATQTILANTEHAGVKLKNVNKVLSELNRYADKTIYNFGQMAKNIGTFTAAGVDLKTATASIKGIANLAALSGSNSEQASTAMYQLSQAISSGRVSLQDWNSVVNAGMGGSVFQRALANTAVSMGVINKDAVKFEGKMKNVTVQGESFRESIMAKPGEQSWLTKEVLTGTLKQFTGDMTDAELAAQGFSKSQIEAIQKQAKTAVDAATKVKTLSGLIDTAKEAAASGWAETWQLIFGDFEEAKESFTGASEALNGFIGHNAEARNKVLKDWKELGGRTALIDGIKAAFEAFGSVIKPIKDAFRDIFPATTGKGLYELTVRFRDFMKSLKLGPDTAENLKRTFRGFFAILDIGWQVLKGVVGLFFDLVGASSDGAGGILQITGGIGDFVTSIRNALKRGDRLKRFFEGLGEVLSIPIKMLGSFAEAIGGLFSGSDAGGAAKGMGGSMAEMGDALKPTTQIVNAAGEAWEGFIDILREAGKLMDPVMEAIGKAFGEIGDVIAKAFEGASFDNVFTALQTTLIGGIFLSIRKALKGGLNFDFGGGALDSLKETFGVLQKSLTAMQTSIKAGILFKIAAAVALLAVAVLALSKVDPDDLAKSMTAISIGLGQLIGAMALLSKVGGAAAFVQMPFIAGSLILLAGAINILALAVILLSKLEWEELARGLAGVAGVLGAVTLAAGPLTAAGPGMVRAGFGLAAIGIGLTLLAIPLKIFSKMKWAELGKGLLAVAGALTAVGLSVGLIPKSIIFIGPGLIALGIGLNAIALAVKVFGSMDLVTLGKGLLGISLALVAIGLAISFIPPTIALTAAGLILVGIALSGIGAAIALMGNLDFGTLVKGITAIAASLAVLAIGLTAMSGTFVGSAALLVAAGALAILAPTLGILGSMKWGTIAKGLAAIALTLGLLAIAGVVAAPGLALVGAALVPLGIGVAAIGGGVYLLAKGLKLLGSDGAKSIGLVVTAFTALIVVIPKLVIDFIKGLVEILGAIAKLAPDIVDAMVKIANSLLDVVIKIAPKIATATTAIVKAILKVLLDNAEPIIAAGFTLLLQLLKGIGDNIGKVTLTVGRIIANFLKAMQDKLPRIINSGANVLVKFLNGIADNLPKVMNSAARVAVKFMNGIAENLPRIIASGARLLVKFLNGVAENIEDVVKAGVRVAVKFIKGVGDSFKEIAKAGVDMVGDFLHAVAEELPKLVDKGFDAVIKFLNGVAKAIRENDKEIGEAGANLGTAIITGVVNALVAGGSKVVTELVNIAGDALQAVKEKLKIWSPSRVFYAIGANIVEGWAIGVRANGSDVTDSVLGIVDGMDMALRAVPDIIDGLVDLDPTITPVLDLTEIEAGAKRLVDLTNVIPITAAASYGQAVSISQSQKPDTGSDDEDDIPPGSKVLKFEQTNISPKALSETEIYRQTQNQLAQAKEALTNM